MTDPDLQVRGWKGGAVIQTLRWGGGGLKKIFFGLRFGLKLRERAGPPDPSPGSATTVSLEILYVDLQGA